MRALLVLLALTACGPSHRPTPVTPDQGGAWVGPLRVIYSGPITPAQRSACEASIAAVVSAWQAGESAPVPAITVEVLIGGSTECGPGTAGCALLGRGRVQVHASYPGYEWSAPATYHEIAHYAYTLRGHTDPRWAAWDRIGWGIGAAFARPDLK